MITTTIIEDSVNNYNSRITTFLLTYPRFIHAQLMTHRVFSRNVSSSRAIPVERMIKSILVMPASPIVYGENKKGMFADRNLGESETHQAQAVWTDAMMNAIESARRLSEIGLHKQHANRLLEPFAHVQTILTATEFDNFFNLRLNHNVQPEMKELASGMKDAMNDSAPVVKRPGEWHLPFLLQGEKEKYKSDSHLLRSISVARCARVSYMSFSTGTTSKIDEDFELYKKLLEDRHLSPFEHQAVSSFSNEMYANFKGWVSWRRVLELSDKSP